MSQIRTSELPSETPGADADPRQASAPELQSEANASGGSHSEMVSVPVGQAASETEYREFIPPVPDTLEETGLTRAQVTDLVLKILHRHGSLLGEEIADIIALPFPLIDDLILGAQQRHFIEVLQALGHGRGGYTFSLTSEGSARAQAALETSRYVGPAPVPLEVFAEVIARQSVRHVHVRKEDLEGAFSDLVLPDGVIESLGPAVNSGGSIFLHGAPGNGKTATAERVGTLTSSTVYLPQAVLVHGSVMILYDPVYHEKVEWEEDPEEAASRSLLFRGGPTHDQRYVKVKRPTVFVGGELTLDQLDLQYDPYSKVYQAPFQLKAAGGVLIIDDFGRQRMRPAELLNRWIVPLEKGFDNLTLHSGIKFPVPFDCILIFATNLNPSDLVDEAFLRRIQYKVEVRSPSREAFEQIFRINCEEFQVPFRDEAVDLLFREYYQNLGFAPRGCHPRDLIKQIQAMSAFLGIEPALDAESIHRAAHSYFLVTEEEFTTGIPSSPPQEGV
jgi:predicted ATPase with chaperone activity